MDVKITITSPESAPHPTHIATHGEHGAIAANGLDADHPSARAWIRAGMAASSIIRHADGGNISLWLFVALIAANADPRHDDSTPERSTLTNGYEGLAPRREFTVHEFGGVRFHAEIDDELRLCDARLGDELHVWVGGYICDDLDGVDDARKVFDRCYLDLDGFRDGDARSFDEVLAALRASSAQVPPAESEDEADDLALYPVAAAADLCADVNIGLLHVFKLEVGPAVEIVVAEDEDDAIDVFSDTDPDEPPSSIDRLGDEDELTLREEDGTRTTRICAEWALRCGRGLLGGSEY